jgi:hypothetical protein
MAAAQRRPPGHRREAVRRLVVRNYEQAAVAAKTDTLPPKKPAPL